MVGGADLIISGALTEIGHVTLIIPPGGNRGLREGIVTLGDAAAYFQNDDLKYRGVAANWRSYVVDISTTGIEPGAPKEAFIPLVQKVISQLQ